MADSQLQCPEVNRLTAERKTLTQMIVTLPDQIRFRSRAASKSAFAWRTAICASSRRATGSPMQIAATEVLSSWNFSTGISTRS